MALLTRHQSNPLSRVLTPSAAPVSPLLHFKHQTPGSQELVSLPGDFATALLRQCRRLTKGAVPAAASAEATTSHVQIRGLLMPDATLPASPGMPLPGMQWAGPALCAELKPKCGWLPRLEVLPPGHEVKARVPKFRLQQAVKLAKVWGLSAVRA